MDKTTHPYFVEDSAQGNRKDTAILLTGTATEFNIPQREVAATQGGFRISENIYKALGWDEDDTNDEVGGNDARQVPGEVVTGQVPVAPQPDDDDEDGFGGDAPEPDTAPDSPLDDDNDDPAAEAVDYSTWDYPDLKAEAKRRGIETEDQRGETLAAALTAADADLDADDEAPDA